MELKEKIEVIIKEKGFSQKQFAESLGLNHISFNRNMSNNNITGEMIKAFIEHLKDVDLNWLFKNEDNGTLELNESREAIYSNMKLNKLNEAMKILEELKRDLSQQ